MTSKFTSYKNLLQKLALAALISGAIGSLYFMFSAGRHQKSVLLIGLFTGWVLSPYLGLYAAVDKFKQWSSRNLTSLYILMIIIAIGSLIIYSGFLVPPGTKPAFIFLVNPLVSWLLMITFMMIVRRSFHNNKTDIK
jgi:hypothetical protein